jgi:hypothetical protein
MLEPKKPGETGDSTSGATQQKTKEGMAGTTPDSTKTEQKK